MTDKEMLTAEEIDALVDAGEVDMTEFIVPGSIRQPNREQGSAIHKVSHSLSEQVADEADREPSDGIRRSSSGDVNA